MNRIQKNVLSVGLVMLTLTLGHALVINSISGSMRSFLSATNVIMPLIGSLISSVAGCCGIFSVWMIAKLCMHGVPITLGLPTLAAMLSWATNNPTTGRQMILSGLLHLGIPLASITLFIMHPVGSQAWVYSMYWLIPMAAWVVGRMRKQQSFFAQALQSTFLAHAVGSVIWLYSFTSTPAYWIALIPVVAAERLIFASSMTIISVIAAGLNKRLCTRDTLVI